jgi:hypothetical protein
MLSEKQLLANRRNALRSTGPRTAAGKALASQNAIRHGLRAEHTVIPGEDADQFDSFRQFMLDDLAPAGALEVMLSDRIVAGFWKLHRAGRIETALLKELNITPPDPDKPKQKQDLPFKIMVTKTYECPVYGKNLESGQTPTDCGSCSLTPRPETTQSKPVAPAVSEDDSDSPAQGAENKDRSGAGREPETPPQPPLALGSLFKSDMSRANILSRFRLYEGQIERSLYKALAELQKLQILRAGRWMPDPSDEQMQVPNLDA